MYEFSSFSTATYSPCDSLKMFFFLQARGGGVVECGQPQKIPGLIGRAPAAQPLCTRPGAAPVDDAQRAAADDLADVPGVEEAVGVWQCSCVCVCVLRVCACARVRREQPRRVQGAARLNVSILPPPGVGCTLTPPARPKGWSGVAWAGW